MKKKSELSVVILCYRSEENLIPVVAEVTATLTQEQIDFELILVANYDANGPADQTPQVAQRIAAKDKRCKYIAEPKQGMMGWDLRSGLMRASGRLIAFLDGDGQTPPSDIVRLYRLLQAEKIDLCKIYRTARADSFLRKLSSILFNFIFSVFYPGNKIRDINGKPKLMTRIAYEKMQLRSSDWFADAEIILEARRLGLAFRELPGVSGPNRWRKSFLTFGALFEFCKNLLVYRVRYWFSKSKRVLIR